MTGKVFLIGLGGAGTTIVKDIESTNHDSFIYRCLDISNDGTLTEENHDQAWEQFFNPSIKSFNLHYNSLGMRPERLKDPSVLFSVIRKYCTKYSSQYQVALIAGLGRRTGSAAILTFATALSYDVRLDLPSSIDRAAFVITPFDFEGRINKKKTEKTLLNLKKILPETKIRTCKNQDLMSSSKDLNLPLAYQISHNAVKDQITFHFSLKKGNPIIKEHGFPNTVSSQNNTVSIVLKILKSILSLAKIVGGDTSTNPKTPKKKIQYIKRQKEEDLSDISLVKGKQKPLPKFLKSIFKLSVYAAFIFAVILGGLVAIKSYQLDDQRIHAAITQPSVLVKIGSQGLVISEAVKCNCERTLQPSELPETFKQALIAIEDKRFYQHVGFDIVSIARAILSFGTRGGGSTIEMQLVKNSIAQPKNDIIRKISELIFAYRINRIFEKDDIVRIYASRVNFGNVGPINFNGLRSAANYYFGKAPENITIEEAAILVATLKNPNFYDPLKNRSNNLKRATAILRLLVADGQASERSIENIEKFMPQKGKIKPYRDRYTEDLIKKEIEKLQMGEGKYRFILSIDPIAQMQASNILKKAVKAGKSQGVARASLVSLDRNGAIKAVIGGQDYLKNSYNLATQAERQAASTSKIVTYLSALELGSNKTTKVFDDQKKLPDGIFVPSNYDNKYAGVINLERCFAQSKNVCTVDVANRLTNYGNLSEMASRLHITNRRAEGSSLVLGAAETTLLKNTAAFASVKNQGFYTKPYLIRFVLGEYGGLVYEHLVDREYVFSENVAAQMKELLEKVVSPEGTANRALIPGRKTFGKTGTSQKNRDAWFVGFSEHGITTGIWVGPTDDGFMRGVSGGTVPSQIFKKFNQNLYERYEFCGPSFMVQSSGYGRDINC